MGFLIDQLKEFEGLVDKIPDLPYLGAIKHTLLGVFEQTKASVSLGGRSPEDKSRLTSPQMTKEALNHYIEAIIHQLRAVGYLLPSIKGRGKAIGLVTKILKK